jgi:hypothetical protein
MSGMGKAERVWEQRKEKLFLKAPEKRESVSLYHGCVVQCHIWVLVFSSVTLRKLDKL